MSLYSRASAGRSLVHTFGFRAVSQLATVLGYVVLVRALARDEFGVYSLLNAFIPVFSTFASLGLEQVLRRYQPEFLANGRPGAAARLLRIISTGRLATNLLLLAVILLAWDFIAPTFKLGPYRQIFIGFSVLILLYFQVRLLQLALSSHMLHRHSAGSTAIIAIVRLLLYSALLLTHRLNLQTAIAIDTAAYAVAWACLRLAYRRHVQAADRGTPTTITADERRRMVRYGLFNNFNDAGVLLMYSTMDTFFIASFASVVAVGIYGFFSRLNEMAANLLPVRLFDNVVQPLLFATPRAEAAQRMPRYFSFLLNLNLAIQLPLLAYALSYHAEIAQLLSGGKYVAESWMLPLLLGFSMLNTVADPASMVAQYEERAGMLLLSKLFAVYNIAAMALLVPHWGIWGAALASGSAQTMKNLFIWWNVRRVAVWVNALRAVPASLLLWGSATAVCVALKAALPAPMPVQLVVGVVVIGCAFLLHLRGPALSESDRSLIAGVAPGRAAGTLRRLGLSARPA